MRLFLCLILLFPISAAAQQTKLPISPALPHASKLSATYCRGIPEDVKPHCSKVLLGNYQRALEKIAKFGPTEEIKNAANELLSYDIIPCATCGSFQYTYARQGSASIETTMQHLERAMSDSSEIQQDISSRGQTSAYRYTLHSSRRSDQTVYETAASSDYSDRHFKCVADFTTCTGKEESVVLCGIACFFCLMPNIEIEWSLVGFRIEPRQ